METQKIESFNLIGISVRTSNDEGKGNIDIPTLWNKFMAEQTIMHIPNKVDQAFYCVYTDYEGDFRQPYTAVLGCKVSTLETIPEGMIGITIPEANYTKFVAAGNVIEGIVFKTWGEIWQTELPRAYKADFEVYGEKALNPEHAEVDIFIGLN